VSGLNISEMRQHRSLTVFLWSSSRLSVDELIALRAMRVKPSGIELDRLNKGEVKKKKKMKQEEKGGLTEEDKWAQQMAKGGLVMRTPTARSDGSKEKQIVDEEEEEEEDSDEEEEGKGSAAAPRLVKQNNFQGETGTVDVDKHMMAYIEEEMKKRRQRGELDGLKMSDADTAKAMLNPDDELYSVDDKYRKILQSAKEALEAAKKNVNGGVREKEKDDQEEGNATLSSAMLNGVPEVDLGMDHRTKNIEETERAKRVMMEAQRIKNRDAKEEEEGDFASARCELLLSSLLWFSADSYPRTVFKYGTKIQSDADILRRPEDVGINEDGTAIEDYSRRQSEYKRQTATDDAALERFKKRQRSQLKR
jgi:hypothetical protein